MAGIGFTLKKMFRDETFSKRGTAYLYSALVAAGPWIATVITVNIVRFIMELFPYGVIEKDIFLGTIVYSFVFSQIFTAPWQMLSTRYIADNLFQQKYESIRPSFLGLNKIVFFSSFIVSLIFYLPKPLPLAYKIMAIYLFIIIAMIWIVMTYLSAVKNYEWIAKAYIYGGLLSIVLAIYLINEPLPFSSMLYSCNILFAYLLGLSLTYIMLLYNFLSTFYFGNKLEFDFIRYLDKLPSLFWIGLFYTLGLWIDDILMWFSIVGVNVYETYQFAPIYDNAVFLAYLTTIPTSVLFLVSIETEFYDGYKKYYGLVNNQGNYKEIMEANHELKEVLYRKLMYTFQVQSLITFTIILLSRPIFQILNIDIITRNIFRICAIGALLNVFILIIILVLLYFEARIHALIIAITFFIGNLILTYNFSNLGLEYYGYGFSIGALITLIMAIPIMGGVINKLNYRTFGIQPLFQTKDKGVFVYLANRLNDYYERKESGRTPMSKGFKNNKLRLNVIISVFLILLFIGSKYTFKTIESQQVSETKNRIEEIDIIDNFISKADKSQNEEVEIKGSNEKEEKNSRDKSEPVISSSINDEGVNNGKSVPPPGYFEYKVKQGDTLFSISMEIYKDKSIVELIRKLNEVQSSNQILSGQILLLPLFSDNKNNNGFPKMYKIGTGETLFSVSMKFYGHQGMIEKIQQINGIKDISDISAGTSLLLPVESVIKQSLEEVGVYTVKEGDTLFSISMKYYGSQNKIPKIMELNGLNNANDLKEGQKIRLPD